MKILMRLVLLQISALMVKTILAAQDPSLDSDLKSNIPKYANYHPMFFPEDMTAQKIHDLYRQISDKCHQQKDVLDCFQTFFPRCSLLEIKTIAEYTLISKPDELRIGDLFFLNQQLAETFSILTTRLSIKIEAFLAPSHGFVSRIGTLSEGEIVPKDSFICTFVSFSSDYPNTSGLSDDLLPCFYSSNGLLKLDLRAERPVMDFSKNCKAASNDRSAFVRGLSELYSLFESRCPAFLEKRKELFSIVLPRSRLNKSPVPPGLRLTYAMHTSAFFGETYPILTGFADASCSYLSSVIDISPFRGICIKSTPCSPFSEDSKAREILTLDLNIHQSIIPNTEVWFITRVLNLISEVYSEENGLPKSSGSQSSSPAISQLFSFFCLLLPKLLSTVIDVQRQGICSAKRAHCPAIRFEDYPTAISHAFIAKKGLCRFVVWSTRFS